ncbi:MAG: hypothetical protein WCY93_10290 [Anaerolineaceae bacterium]
MTEFAMTDAARLLTLRCAWARYAVVLRDCVTENSIMSLRTCEAVSNFQDGIAYPSLRLGTLRSRSSQ